MAWSFRHETDADGVASYWLVDEDGPTPTRRDALQHLAEDGTFRHLLARRLAEFPHEAFFWECPPTSQARQEWEFEFVLIPTPTLARARADPSSFSAQFDLMQRADVVTFGNLGGDATLVVPAPRAAAAAYAHLGAFVRTAPPKQVDTLFQSLASAITERLSNEPLWVSTAGLGVPWLHIGLDSHPNYYRHAPFKRFS